MRTYYYAEAVDNLVISRDHAVTFENETLDYIPGSVVLGALASEIYQDNSCSDDEKFSLFQNNSSNRFSNAYPLKVTSSGNSVHGETVLPTPLCLHYPKNKKPVKDELVNKCAGSDDDSIQYKQMRGGYLSADMQQYSVTCGTITRTSIDFMTQTADEGKLFNQKYIEKGAVFLGYIDYAEQHRELIKKFLDGTEIRVGKSRYSEFGRIRLSIAEVKEPAAPSPVQNNLLYIWCLSDCQFIDLKTGQPTLIPQGSNLWQLSEKCSDLELTYKPEKSFIRTSVKRYFNRKRGGFDGDRQLINKGSVICFELNKAPDAALLAEQQNCGLGLDRQLGYGQILINPEWINNSRITKLFAPVQIELNKAVDSAEEVKLNPNLITYLRRARESFKDSINSQEKIDAHRNFVAKLYADIRSCNRVDPDQDFGPTITQWNVIFERIKLAGQDNYLDEVHTVIFENIGNDLNPSPSNTKKETNKEEFKVWGARLFDREQRRLSYFAEKYYEYLVKNKFTRNQLLYILEVQVKNDFSNFEVLKPYLKKGENNE